MHSQTPPVIGYKNVSDRFVKSMSVDRPDPTGGRGRNMEVIEHWDSLYQNLASQVSSRIGDGRGHHQAHSGRRVGLDGVLGLSVWALRLAFSSGRTESSNPKPRLFASSRRRAS